MDTLTRAEAHDLIDDQGTDAYMLGDLCIHWIGHDEFDGTLQETEQMLHDYVNDCADMLFDGRAGRNPSDSDDTGLTAPVQS